MKGDRRKRLGKVVEHRTRELERKLVELARATTAEIDARARLEEARTRTREAIEARATIAATGATSSEWLHAEAWVETRRRGEHLAEQSRLTATRAVEAARADVVEARSQLSRIEMLIERIDREDRLAQERQGRKLDDEFAVRAALEPRRRSPGPSGGDR